MALVGLVGLLSIWAFLVGFYAAVFHSDSAAHQVLAQAMLEEGSLLPRDFAYGNQLILWRNNLFIAPALALGFTGYKAYVAGSAVTFVLAFLVAFLCIESMVQDWRRSLLASWLFFLPLGHSEADFILGQQSHVGTVVLALVIVVQAFRASEGHRRALTLCAIAVFMLAVEAPTRVAMLLLPLFIALWASGRWPGTGRLLAGIVIAALAGYAGNRWLIAGRLVTGIPPMPLAGYDHFLSRASQLLKGIVDYFIGFYQFEGMASKPVQLALYGLKSLALGLVGALSVWLTVRLARRVGPRLAPQRLASGAEFVGITGLLGTVLGFWIVCAIEYWLDIRHFLWALMLVKLALVLLALEWLWGRPRARMQLGLLCVLAFLTSTAGSAWLVPAYRDRVKYETIVHQDRDVSRRIGERMSALKNHLIFGEYWATLRAEVLVPGAQASTLRVDDAGVHFVSFLTRLSRRCVRGEVLYQLDRGTPADVTVIEKVLAAGGREIERLHINRTLYAGPPVWDQQGCP